MHSYIQDPNDESKWVVIFYLPQQQEAPRHVINVVKRFDKEIDAAFYVSFLNGGPYNE